MEKKKIQRRAVEFLLCMHKGMPRLSFAAVLCVHVVWVKSQDQNCTKFSQHIYISSTIYIN